MLILCDGNSLTVGQHGGAQATYPIKLGALRPSDTVTNKGVDAQTTAQMMADAVSDIDALFTAGAWVICWEGTNDIYFNASAETAYTNLSTYCADRQAAGFKVAVLTILPRNDFPGSSSLPSDQKTNHDSRRATVNTNLRANWATFADALVDVAADAALDDETDTTYFYTDLVHLNDAGYARVAALVNTALSSASSGRFSSVFSGVIR